MYADTELLLPYLQTFSPDFHGYCNKDDNASSSSMRSRCRSSYRSIFSSYKQSFEINMIIQASTISEYNLGGEGDLFKAPEPIISEPLLDPTTSALSMISCGGDEILTTSGFTAIDDQNEQLFYECKKDLMEMAAAAKQFPDNHVRDDVAAMSKSVSSGCLSSMDPSFLDFNGGLDFSYGMRRAFSEGDMQTISNGTIGLSHSPRPLIISCCTSDASRKEKLSRYRDKKNRRNFGRKIKYACRKALADSQPRIRGRFAKTEGL